MNGSGDANNVATNNPNVNGEDNSVQAKDQLHLVTDGFYAGHPNPFRASGNEAGLFKDGNAAQIPVPAGWGTIAPDLNGAADGLNPQEGVWIGPGNNDDGGGLGPDGSLYTIGSSSNGLIEYSANGITDVVPTGGNVVEVLAVASFNNKITLMEVQGDETQGGMIVTDSLEISVNGNPLDITAVGNSNIPGVADTAGTMWVAHHGADNILILEPGTPVGPDTDHDNDGLEDNVDHLQYDPANGTSTVLSGGQTLFWDFNPGDSGLHPNPDGPYDIGMTGWQTNGTDYLDGLTDLENTIRGGAPGIFQVKQVGDGDTHQGNNTQKDAIQTGFMPAADVHDFTIGVPILNPFSSNANSTVTWGNYNAMGFSLGVGDMSNWIKFVVGSQNNGVYRMEIALEEDDSNVTSQSITAPQLVSGTVDDDQILLSMKVDMTTFQATFYMDYQVNAVWQGQTQVGNPVQLPTDGNIVEALKGEYLNNGQPSAPVVTMVSTSFGPGGTPFVADFLEMTITANEFAAQTFEDVQNQAELDALNPTPAVDTVDYDGSGNIVLPDGFENVDLEDNANSPLTVTLNNDDNMVTAGPGDHTVDGQDGADTYKGTSANLDGDTFVNFGEDDQVIVQNTTVTIDNVAEGSAIVTLSDGSEITFEGDFDLSGFSATPSSGDTIITYTPSEVLLYRVNAGGGLITATDGGLDWAADTTGSNHPALVNAGNNATSAFPGTDPVYQPGGTVPTTTPGAIFDTERYDGGASGDPLSSEMQWAFDVSAYGAGNYEVRLYMGNGYSGTNDAGERVFDVAIEGSVPSNLDDVDLSGQFGHENGVMISNVVAVDDGTLNIDFLHGIIENPLVNGIEIIKIGSVGPVESVVSIGDPTPNSVQESGDTGNTTLVFPVTFDTPPASAVTVEYSTDVNGVVTNNLTQALGTGNGAISVDVPNDDADNGSDSVTVTLTGITVGDGVANLGTTQASATVTEDDAAAGSIVAAINAGGPALSQGGIDFAADQHFAGGTTFEDNGNGNGEQTVFDGTVFETERYGNFSYAVPVNPGAYTVELYLAELYQDNPGQRVFDVSVEGALVLDDYDILPENGGDINVPIVLTLPGGAVSPDDDGNPNTIDIQFNTVENNAKVGGIVVRQAGDAGPPPDSFKGIAASGGDFSGDHANPTPNLALAEGNNTLVATQQGDPHDDDYFTLVVPADHQLTDIILVDYEGGSGNFMGIDFGSQFEVDLLNADPNATQNWLNGGTVFDDSFIGQSLYARLASGNIEDSNTGLDPLVENGGFTPPLGQGTYSFGMSQGGDQSTATLNFVLEPVSTQNPGAHLPNANGNFAFEAESAVDPGAGGFEFLETDDLPNGHEAPSAGEYVEATSNHLGNQNGETLTYKFTPAEDGFVRVNLLASFQGESSTEHNDSWTKIELNGVGIPALPQGGENLVSSNGYYKTYSSGGNELQFILANKNFDNNGQPIVVPMEAGKTYDFLLSERSAGHEVDKIVLEFSDNAPSGYSGESFVQNEPLSPQLPIEQVGAATLAINENSNNVQISNYGDNSFEITNVGTKDIAKVEIDVTNALFPDSVFDPFGKAGDTTAKLLTINTNGGTGVVAPDHGTFDNPGSTYIGTGGPNGIDGFEGVQILFDQGTNNGFNPGETLGFAVDMDPNSIAGAAKGTLDDGSDPGWDIGGISGAELIGSSFTVTFADGSTATGQLHGKGNQGGSKGLATQDAANTEVTLTVNGLAVGGVGTYDSGGPTVIVNGPAGETARVVLAKGIIQPVTNEFHNGNAAEQAYAPQLDAQLAALAASDFPANNAVEFQTFDVVLTGGDQDITNLFDFTQVSEGQPLAVNEAQVPLGIVAGIIDPDNGDLPLGPVSSPIHLQFSENTSPDAIDDLVQTDENAVLNGDVLADNGNGADTDPDAGDTLTVTEVNGEAGDVGQQISLTSGALLTLNDDGTFSYDPNGAFDGLADGETGQDSFSYTIDDGNGGTDTATVALTINGVSPADDIDSDGILNTDDPFAFDGTNGDAKLLVAGGEFLQDFNTDTNDPFSAEAGFSGIIVNPAFDPAGASESDPYGDRTTEAGVSIQGGVLNVDSSNTDLFGTATGSDNTIKDNYHSAADVTGVDGFEVVAKTANPFFGTAPVQYASSGITLGAGGVDDYIKFVYGGAGSNPRIQLGQENSLTGVKEENITLSSATITPADVKDIEFKLVVDKVAGTVQGTATLFGDGGGVLGAIQTAVRTVTGSLALAFDGQNPLTGDDGGIAYGVSITDWSNAAQFTGEWDFLRLTALDEVVTEISIGDPTVAEDGDTGETTLSFALTATTAINGDVDVEFNLTGPATPPASPATVTFVNGVASLDVTVANDDLATGDEQIGIQVTNATVPASSTVVGTISIADGEGTGLVTEDDFAPVAAGDTAATSPDQAVTILAADLVSNDTDADNTVPDDLSIASVGTEGSDGATAEGGTVSVDVNGDVLFTPLPGFSGQDSFSYIVTDLGGNTSQATVTVAMSDVDLGATITVDGNTTFGNGSFNITNTSQAGVIITDIQFDIVTSTLSLGLDASGDPGSEFLGAVWDPTAAAGDEGGQALKFTNNDAGLVDEHGVVLAPQNSGNGYSGIVGTYPFTGQLPGGNAGAPGGFRFMDLAFDNFDANESFVFGVDVDPQSIQGATGTGQASAVSGGEISGTTATITFEDTNTGQTYQVTRQLEATGLDGSKAVFTGGDPLTAPTLEVAGLTNGARRVTVGLRGRQRNVSGQPVLRRDLRDRGWRPRVRRRNRRIAGPRRLRHLCRCGPRQGGHEEL